MTVDELVDMLRKPMFVLQFAKHGEQIPLDDKAREAMKKSCEARAENARNEIDRIVQEYVVLNSTSR